ERMGEVAGMRARLLRLLLRMFEQGVELLDHRLDLERERVGDAVAPGRADAGDGAAYPAQWPEPVPGLRHRHEEQPDPEHRERPHEDRADTGDLLVELGARCGDDEVPLGLTAGQGDGPFDHAQRLVLELVRVFVVRLAVSFRKVGLEPPVPQRARGIILVALTAYLVVESAV